MLPLKLVRSMLLGQSIHPFSLLYHSKQPPQPNNGASSAATTTKKTPVLLFLPTKEIVSDTYRLASIARDMGMDLIPTPSLSHIVFSYPSSTTSPSTASPLCNPSSWSSSWPLPDCAAVLPFPSLSSASLSHLRAFVALSRGLFKLALIAGEYDSSESNSESFRNWDCCSVSLFSRMSGDRIDSMEAFCRALAGNGWTLFKTKRNPSADSAERAVYLFRKVDPGRVPGHGRGRVRELRLPALDFRNSPLRILQYVVLITDNVFCLG